MLRSRLETILLTAGRGPFFSPPGDGGESGGAPATDVLTKQQMTSLLRTDATQVDQVAQKYDAAAQTYTYKTGRQHFLTDEAHQASFREYVGPLEEAEAVAIRVAGAASRNALAVKSHLVETITVSDADMVAVAQRQPMIRQDIAELPLPRLAEDVRLAIARDDKPAMYLFARYLSERTKAGDRRSDRPEEAAARDQLSRMVLQIRETLRDTSFDDVRKQIAVMLEKAGTLESRARQRRREAVPRTTIRGEAIVPWPRAS